MSRIDEIEARLAAATPGPWENEGGGEIGQHYSRPQPWQTVVGTEVSCSSYCYGGSTKGVERDADATLIANAPADLAALVKFARDVAALHVQGPVTMQTLGFDFDADEYRTRLLTTCKGCHHEWPCLTARALAELDGGAS